MDAFVIHGGKRLRGRVRIHGSKNSSLPLLAAALLTEAPVVLHEVPDLSDIRNMTKLLGELGCAVEAQPEPHGQSISVRTTDPDKVLAHYEIVRTMRAGVCVLGPLLAKRGKARVSMPGGCSIGDRPVDLHIRGLRALGAKIHLDEGYIVAEAPGGRLHGARVFMGGPFGSTVLGTDNILCAAVLAEGTTIIESAACEPEVADLADMLNAMGARVRGAGSPRIIVEGVDQLHGVEHTVIPDRIEAGTYIMAAAVTNGDVTLENCPTDALTAALDRLIEIGVAVEPVLEEVAALTPSLVPIKSGGRDNLGPPDSGGVRASSTAPGSTRKTGRRQVGNGHAVAATALANGNGHNEGMRETVHISSARRLEPVHVVTQPHPGFPTDLQAQIMALLCLADGNSIITEKIFPDRFLHVAEMLRMGANLIRNGPSVMVSGVHKLIGAPVMASDLRASAGLVLAGLGAKGTTTINRVYHLDRGYERMELTLQSLGADIERISVPGA